MITTIEAVGPGQINVLGSSASGAELVTVTYPPGRDTVLSIQPDGTSELRPHGTAGAYERAIRTSDRITYAPLGNGGSPWVVAYCADLPNV